MHLQERVVGSLGAVWVEAKGQLLELLPASRPLDPGEVEQVLEMFWRGERSDGEADGTQRGQGQEEVDKQLRVVSVQR